MNFQTLYWTQNLLRCWAAPKSTSKAVSYSCVPTRKDDNCGENIEMRKALAAMSNENDRGQWFTDGVRWYQCTTKIVHPDYRALGYHKATKEEIIEHYINET